MTNKEKAEWTYNMLLERKKNKEEGIKQARSHVYDNRTRIDRRLMKIRYK